MTPSALYLYLDKAGIEYDVVETFEGLRTISFEVEEDEPEEHGEWSNHDTQFIFFKLFDGFDPYDHFPDDQATMRDWLGEELKEYAEVKVREATNTWAGTENLANDLAMLFLSNVNWEEIASYLYATYSLQEDGGVR